MYGTTLPISSCGAAQSKLRSIPWMARRFGVPLGYSDHTIGYEIPLAAVALGATIIEKHISLDKHIATSQDAKVSCDRSDLAAMVQAICPDLSAINMFCAGMPAR